MNGILALYLYGVLYSTATSLYHQKFLFSSSTKQHSVFSVWHQLGPFYNGFTPFWFDKRHLRSAHDLFYLSIE